jgi:hypothetical protein
VIRLTVGALTAQKFVVLPKHLRTVESTAGLSSVSTDKLDSAGFSSAIATWLGII